MEPDGRLIWTYFEALKPDKLPKSLLIVGAGAIGVEFASFYRAFGVEVTLVEALPRILPAEDAEIAALARKSFVRQGIEILDGTKVSAVEKRDDRVIATLTGADGATRKIEAERLLSAAGVVANVEGFGLEALSVKIERGVIAVDGSGATNVAGISRSATWRAGRCWPTRPNMRASPASRRSRAKTRIRARKHPFPRAHTRIRRSPRSG